MKLSLRNPTHVFTKNKIIITDYSTIKTKEIESRPSSVTEARRSIIWKLL